MLDNPDGQKRFQAWQRLLFSRTVHLDKMKIYDCQGNHKKKRKKKHQLRKKERKKERKKNVIRIQSRLWNNIAHLLTHIFFEDRGIIRLFYEIAE